MEFAPHAALSLVNQDFVKMERSYGIDSRRWRDHMTILLTALKIYYGLDQIFL